MNGPAPDGRSPLREVAELFLKLGLTAFGGPAAHIAMMEQEVVLRRRWLSRQEFLDLLGAVNLIPGPSSTELAIFLGYRRAGWPGLLLGGACFILPAALLVTAIAWAYVRFGRLPQIQGMLYGVKPVVIALVAQALWKLGRTAVKTKYLLILGLLAAALNAFGVNPLAVLLGAGLLTAATRLPRRADSTVAGFCGPFLGIAPALPAVAFPVGLWPLFLFFLKIGSIVFGSGYVLLAFLRADLVTHWHWLTENQLLDAVAVGQFTPGPVFTTATFIGYTLAGTAGAATATVAIFLPSFLLVAMIGPFAPRLRQSAVAGAFLDGVNIAALALMAVVTVQLGAAAFVDAFAVALALVSAALLLRFEVNAAWLALGGIIIGLGKTMLAGN